MSRHVVCGLLIAKLKNIVVLSSFIHRQSERIYPIEDDSLFYGIKKGWVRRSPSHVGIESCSLPKGISLLRKSWSGKQCACFLLQLRMWREKSVLFTLRKKILVFDKVVTRHFIGLLESHDVKDRRCYVGKDTILYLGVLILRHVDKGHGVE